MGDARVGICQASNLDGVLCLFPTHRNSIPYRNPFPGIRYRSALTALRAPPPGPQRHTVFLSAIIARPRTEPWACISLLFAPSTWTNGRPNNF